MRRVLAAISGALLSEFLDRVLSQLNWVDTTLYLLHIVDTRPLKEFGLAAGVLPAGAGRAAARLREMGALGAEAGQHMLEEAEALAAPRLITAAHEIEADLIVLGAAEDPAGPPPPPGRRGPRAMPEGPHRFPRRHLSPTVRYIIDHAPCDVLLLYAGPRDE